VIVTAVLAVSAIVVIVKVAVVAPVVNDTVAGTVTGGVPPPVMVAVIAAVYPDGAAELIVTFPVDVPTPVTLVGLTETAVTVGNAIVTVLLAADVPPPGVGVNTVTVAVPAEASRAGDTVAVRLVAETYVVGSAVPFQSTTDTVWKLDPVTVRVCAVVTPA